MTASLVGQPGPLVGRTQRLVIGGTLAAIAAVSWGTLIGGLAMDPGLDARLFLVTWLAMVGAMMVPTIEPMVHTFVTLLHPYARPVRWVRTLLFVLPYLMVWGAVGLIALGIRSFALDRPIVASVLIASAGLYQLTAVKQACLGSCRSPLGFMLQHGAAARSMRGTLVLGARHAGLCFGCCVGLMVAITGAGAIELSWMAALGLLMLIEKTHPRGTTFARASGIGLLAIAPLPLWVPLMGPIASISGLAMVVALVLGAIVLRATPGNAPSAVTTASSPSL